MQLAAPLTGASGSTTTYERIPIGVGAKMIHRIHANGRQRVSYLRLNDSGKMYYANNTPYEFVGLVSCVCVCVC
jgi:hypothetical protein